jgi:dipeptidyl aminopeptidase/acylaminoacyl peptidase
MPRAQSLRRASQGIAPCLLALSTAFAVVACSDRSNPASPVLPGAASPIEAVASPKRDRLATIEQEGTREVLYLQNADGSDRTRVYFRNVQDHVAGNYSVPVTDETIRAIRRAKWSPDGQSLAVIVVPAAGVAEVVLVNADGHDLRTVSPNSQYLYGAVEWSPDSRRIAYAMSTGPFALSPDLFVTDLGPDQVTRVTTSGMVGGFDTFRFDPTGQRIHFTERLGYAEDGANGIFRLGLADLTSGVVVRTDTILGEPQGIARGGSSALLLRWNAERVRELVRIALPSRAETVLATGDMLNAVLLEGDAEALVVSPDLNGARTFRVVGSGAPNDVRTILRTARNVNWAAFVRSSR